MYTKNPYDVPYSEMVEGATFYDRYREEWVTLSEPYDSSRKSYWLAESDGVDNMFVPLVHLDDLAYDDGNDGDEV